MIAKIQYKDYPDDFERFIDDFEDFSKFDHRRGSTFYARALVDIDEKFFPEFPELHGLWETNDFVFSEDDVSGSKEDINTLYRVKVVEKISYEYVRVENEEQ